MKNKICDLCDAMLDSIVDEYNDKLERQYEDAGGKIKKICLLQYDGMKDIIEKLPKKLQEKYETLQDEVIEECEWNGIPSNSLEEKQRDIKQYYNFHKKIEISLKKYLSKKHKIM